MKDRVLVTGASGGLGKAFAAECAARGWDLCLTDRSEAALTLLAAGLERMYGVDVAWRAADLTVPADREELWADLAARGETLCMAVNVAGLDFEGPFTERTSEELCTIVRVNIESVVAVTHSALTFRNPMKPFAVINVSSLAGFQPMPVKAVYAASKRFLLDLSIALGREMKSQGVTFTALCPAGMPSNPQVIRAIDAQGFLGQLTTMNVGTVASRTLDRAVRRSSVYVPGVLNTVVGAVSRLIPPGWTAAWVGRRWEKARARASAPNPTPEPSVGTEVVSRRRYAGIPG
jgi:short-subunit dehydrogenase